MRILRVKLNSAAVAPSKFEETVDDQFMQDMSSVLTLEDGSSLDLKKTVLLYNPNTHKIQLTDSGDIPKDFIQVATLTVTPDEPTPVDIPMEVPPEFEEEEPLPEDEPAEQPEGEEEEPTPPRKESADFFQ